MSLEDQYRDVNNKLQVILAITNDQLRVVHRTKANVQEQCDELGLDYECFKRLRAIDVTDKNIKRLTEKRDELELQLLPITKPARHAP